MMGSSDRRGGFALLMVLVALALLATVLTLRTRQMMERSLVWDAQAREVQTRWAQRTVAESMAPQALALLGMDEQSEEARQPPRATWGTTLALGPVAVEVHVSDEQAKLNLHTLADVQDVRDVLPGLSGPRLANRVRLRPLDVALFQPEDDTSDIQDDGLDGNDDLGGNDDLDENDDLGGNDDLDENDDSGQDDGNVVLIERPGQYLTFGQVLDHPTAGELMGKTPGRGLTARWTLWGDGRINVKTADPATLRVMLVVGVDGARTEQILAALQKTGGNLKRLFDVLPRYDLVEEDQYAMSRLTDTSDVQGLWVRARSADAEKPNRAANESAAFYVIHGNGRPRRVQTW